MKMISVIIPCFNESTVLKNTFLEIKKVLKEIKKDKFYDYEILFIDDGSTDQTLKIIIDIAEKNQEVKYISFSRNFGKESAMIAGLEHVSGDAVVIMDADLQHPPNLIKQMVEKYEQGYNQVIARRDRQGEKFLRKWISRFYYKLVNKLMDVELADGVGDFRILSRNAVNAIINMPEYNRFSKGIFSWIGFRKTVINYRNQERVAGESKWGFKSLLNYALEGIISFNNEAGTKLASRIKKSRWHFTKVKCRRLLLFHNKNKDTFWQNEVTNKILQKEVSLCIKIIT